MNNQTNIDFTSKFHLLNSQKNSQEIIWSCSDSSDYETTHKENSLNMSNKILNRKRKRANKKPINKFNLDINYTDSQNKVKSSQKSSHLEKYNSSKSPIICQRNVKTDITLSPIILLKRAVPLAAVKIKKKLFETNLQGSAKSKSEGCIKYCTQNKNNTNKESEGSFINTFENFNNLTDCFNAEKRNIINSTSNQKLKEKVKSYFDSHFSSQSTQHSISECETESSKSNDVEITSSLTPTVLPIKLEPKSSSDSLSFDQEIGTKSKKVRYKKNGLSYRLNSLIKKQNASFSLWHHEKFLAVNSSFVIPREEFIAFQIQNVNSKCGLFLLEARDSDSKEYLILINNLYINNNVLEPNAIFKLYKPFRVIDFDINYMLIVNVCKFECTGIVS